MSRYRPPRPRSSPYITEAGYQRLNDELKYLWKEKRPEVTRKVSEAAAQGDRSENAEYIYRKKELAGLDRRIRYLHGLVYLPQSQSGNAGFVLLEPTVLALDQGHFQFFSIRHDRVSVRIRFKIGATPRFP